MGTATNRKAESNSTLDTNCSFKLLSVTCPVATLFCVLGGQPWSTDRLVDLRSCCPERTVGLLYCVAPSFEFPHDTDSVINTKVL